WPGVPVHATGKTIPPVRLDVSGLVADLHAPARQGLLPGPLLSAPVRLRDGRDAAVRPFTRLALAGMAADPLHSLPGYWWDRAGSTGDPSIASERPGGVCAPDGRHECKNRNCR